MLGSTNAIRFYKKSLDEKPKLFANSYLDFLYSADDKMLAQGEHDKIVEKCIVEAELVNCRETLKQLAFILFSGSRVNCNNINQELLRKQWAFILLINDDTSALSDCVFVLRDCYNCWKKLKSKHDFIKVEQTSNLSLLTPISKTLDISDEDEILITHGGGYFHIQAFLQGKVMGYKLEGNCGYGLQVHVMSHNKTLHYSNVKSWLHMDEPAFLIAHIKAKYLCTQNRNGYEAGLRAEWASKLKNIQVIKMPHLWLGNGMHTLITESSYSQFPKLQAKIKDLYERFDIERNEASDKQKELWRLHFLSKYRADNIIKTESSPGVKQNAC